MPSKGENDAPVTTLSGLAFELVKEIADGKWDGGITATALRERAQLITYGVKMTPGCIAPFCDDCPRG